MTLISVLIPVYNGIEYLEQSLGSVLSQTYTDWEVIIGINGHPANSPLILDINEIVNLVIDNSNSNSNLKDKIRVIYYETNGKPATMNKMRDDSRGDYVAVLDVDDIWYPKKLEKQIPYLYDYDVIGTHCRYFECQTNTPVIPFGDLSNYNFLSNGNPIINSSSLIRKELATWTEDEYFDDYDLWLQLSHKKKKFFNINEILVLHRIHSSSAFNLYSNRAELEKRLQLFKEKWSLVYN